MSKNKPQEHNPPAQPQSGQVVSETTLFHQGPLPPPSTLQQYNEVVPGAADRIIAMAESQMRHRQGIENKVNDCNIKNAQRGQVFGFTIGVLGLAVGAFLIYLEKTIWGSIFSGITLLALVTVFVQGSRQRQLERTDRAQQ